MSFGRRMGKFTVTIGFFLFLYYVFSTASEHMVSALFLLGGVALIGLGFLLIFTHPLPEPPDSGRFRVLRRKPRKRA